MSAFRILLSDVRNAFVKALPNLTVLFTVLLLLRGFWGSLSAFKVQLITLAGALFGPGEGLTGVLLHTLPLAIAAAFATFAIASGALKFESFSSVVVLAGIIVIGTSLGGFLRQLVPDVAFDEAVAANSIGERPEKPAEKPTQLPIPIQPTAPEHTALSVSISKSYQLRSALPKLNHTGIDALPTKPSVSESPWQQLRKVDWLAEPNLSKAAPREIPPLELLPTPGGVVGFVTAAINQLLGFLVSYQPRLFLAAILAGSWFGWSWHRRLQTLHQRVVEEVSDDVTAYEVRRAA